jgi:hypothetical protein
MATIHVKAASVATIGVWSGGSCLQLALQAATSAPLLQLPLGADRYLLGGLIWGGVEPLPIPKLTPAATSDINDAGSVTIPEKVELPPGMSQGEAKMVPVVRTWLWAAAGTSGLAGGIHTYREGARYGLERVATHNFLTFAFALCMYKLVGEAYAGM